MNSTKLPLFGTDGIRGIAGEYPLDKKNIVLIGSCSALILKKYYNANKIFIGWDTRESSTWISQLLIKTFSESGYDVYSVNVFSTPGIAFLCHKYSSIGIVVSASHNPYEFNGIKFFSHYGTKLPDDIETEIEDLISQNANSTIKTKTNKVKSKIINFYDQAEKDYTQFLLSVFYDKQQSLNTKFETRQPLFTHQPLVIDCANGSTYKIATKVFGQIFNNCKFKNINPDGRNINNNCGSMFPNTLKKYITNDEIGLAFDGDGDRVIFVDEKKNIRDGDYILGILATEYKKNKMLKNNMVVPTIMSNLGLLKYLWSKNIKTILSPVGDKNVYEYIKNYNVSLGGEQSGHIILPEYLTTGDGILTAIEVLKVVLNNKTKLYKLCSIFEKYPQVIKNLEVQEKPILENIFPKKMVKELERKVEGRIILRYSGTEPLLRIMVEGKNELQIKKVAQILEKHYIKMIKK